MRCLLKLEISCVIIGVFLLTSCSTSSTQSTQVELAPLPAFTFAQRYLTAVLPFDYKDENRQFADMVGNLADMTMAEMFKTKRFRIVERSRIDAVLAEIKLSQSGVTSEKLADQVGRQLGAEMVLVCSVGAIKPIEARDTLGIAWIETKGFEVTLNARLIGIKTGEVIAISQATGMEVNKIKVAMGATTGEEAPASTLLKRAIGKAVKILVHDFAAQLPPKL